jgi:hypothetical protein
MLIYLLQKHILLIFILSNNNCQGLNKKIIIIDFFDFVFNNICIDKKFVLYLVNSV